MAKETSDGIAPDDWDRVHEAALDRANASEIEMDEATQRMLCLLDELEQAYGKRPSLVATRADYVTDVNEREALYHQAFALARARGDEANLLLISQSLAELYIEELKDVHRGRRWLDEYRRRRATRGDSHDEATDGDLTRALMALHVDRPDD